MLVATQEELKTQQPEDGGDHGDEGGRAEKSSGEVNCSALAGRSGLAPAMVRSELMLRDTHKGTSLSSFSFPSSAPALRCLSLSKSYFNYEI